MNSLIIIWLEENCELIEYNYEKEKSKCSCDIKTSIPDNYEIKFNKNEFFKSFKDINNIINLNVMKCYKVVFRIKGLIRNYGFFIMNSIIIFYFISLLIFITVSNDKMKKEVNKIIFAVKFNEIPIKNIKNIKSEQLKDKPTIIKKRKKKKKKKNSKVINTTDKSMNEKKLLDLNKINDEKKEILFSKFKPNLEDKSENRINLKQNEIIDENKKNVFNQILAKKDFELNSLDYEEGKKLDKRNYCEYYISLLKNNHPLMFSFSSFNDYNSKIIKILLFFFFFSLDLTVNALFFTDDIMHKIYQDKGQFNFLYQIPQILYSTFISRFIDSLIKNFALTQDNIVEIKQETELKNLELKHKKLLKVLKIKFIVYFILTFITLIFFWYYLSCFCGIYINTQIHLIKDTIISLITSLLIPFGLFLVPGIFRIPALKEVKQNRKCLYKFSSFLENYLG